MFLFNTMIFFLFQLEKLTKEPEANQKQVEDLTAKVGQLEVIIILMFAT